MKTITKLIYSTFAVAMIVTIAIATTNAQLPTQQAPSANIRVITTFDYPGTGNLTRPGKINDAGDIVGSFIDPSGAIRGFVRFANGNFSAPIVEPLDVANATFGRGINNSGLVCGEYSPTDSNYQGYFLSNGNFSEFEINGSTDTAVLGVNNVGDFSGGFYDATGLGHAFVSIGGTITTFVVPGATVTTAYQLNSSNQTEGYYADGSGIFHGYWREANGTLHFPIDPPGSTFTNLFGNNDSNWMVGTYIDGAGTHGLLFVPPNGFFSFNYPGSTFTSFNGINAQGFICGRYRDASGIEHGILARVVGVPRPHPTPHPRPTQ
jgi:hypothetical protein